MSRYPRPVAACHLLWLGLGLATMTTNPATATTLAPNERVMVDQIATRIAPATALLRELVEIDSGTFDVAGVRRVGDRLEPEFAGLGFTVRWVDGSSFERAGHLVAHRPGSGPHVLLIGHLDTVFEPSSGFSGWHPVGDHLVRGPGITDMKGGIVVLLEALRALAHVGALDQLEVTVVLTGDEERPGRPLEASRAALLEAGTAADVALGFEDGDGLVTTAVVGRRGSSRWRLEVEATTAHSSQIHQPAVGAGAAYELARILDAFRQELADEVLLTVSPGLVAAGSTLEVDPTETHVAATGKDNIVAARANASGDLRAASPEQRARVEATMVQIVAASLPGTSSRISFDHGYPPMAASPSNLALLRSLDQASRDLGHGPVTAVDPRNAGAADVSMVADRVEAALDGLGLMGTGGHTLEETADMRTFPIQIERTAVLLYRFATGAIPLAAKGN